MSNGSVLSEVGAMESPSRLLLEFASTGVVSKGELYLPVDVARNLVGRCRERSIVILGVEAFELLDGKILPRLDLIADFSEALETSTVWSETVTGTAVDAGRFLDEVERTAPALYVNFSLKAANR